MGKRNQKGRPAKMQELDTRRYLVGADFPKRPGLCRVCGKSLSSEGRTCCGEACRHTLAFMTSIAVQKREIWKRDHGVCELCGYDAGKAARIYAWARTLRRGIPHWRTMPPQILQTYWRPMWAKPHWEMDHCFPVASGGGLRPGVTVEKAMSNLWTLCQDCHAQRRGHRSGGQGDNEQ